MRCRGRCPQRPKLCRPCRNPPSRPGVRPLQVVYVRSPQRRMWGITDCHVAPLLAMTDENGGFVSPVILSAAKNQFPRWGSRADNIRPYGVSRLCVVGAAALSGPNSADRVGTRRAARVCGPYTVVCETGSAPLQGRDTWPARRRLPLPTPPSCEGGLLFHLI